mmetsp:Transcript_54083/g.87540  ORF Transcript_54083/g.87540 Transcript_54083/m.87540 type:complete len:217 (+) Transcript_54083:485-1135(+)
MSSLRIPGAKSCKHRGFEWFSFFLLWMTLWGTPPAARTTYLASLRRRPWPASSACRRGAQSRSSITMRCPTFTTGCSPKTCSRWAAAAAGIARPSARGRRTDGVPAVEVTTTHTGPRAPPASQTLAALAAVDFPRCRASARLRLLSTACPGLPPPTWRICSRYPPCRTSGWPSVFIPHRVCRGTACSPHPCPLASGTLQCSTRILLLGTLQMVPGA